MQRNPLDGNVFNSTNVPADITSVIDNIRQNPQAYEAMIRQNNPQAARMLDMVRGSANPQALVMQMAQARGINPSILQMLGLK